MRILQGLLFDQRIGKNLLSYDQIYALSGLNCLELGSQLNSYATIALELGLLLSGPVCLPELSSSTAAASLACFMDLSTQNH